MSAGRKKGGGGGEAKDAYYGGRGQDRMANKVVTTASKGGKDAVR